MSKMKTKAKLKTNRRLEVYCSTTLSVEFCGFLLRCLYFPLHYEVLSTFIQDKDGLCVYNKVSGLQSKAQSKN